MITESVHIEEPAFLARELPPARLGTALLGEEEAGLALEAIRSQRLFRYAYDLPAQEQGRMTARLESEVQEQAGVRYALGVTSGTAALEVALAALGVGPGDEVIIPAWSWISCFTSVVRVGALPVMAEIDETLCLAPVEIERKVTPRTKAVMVVHYQGVAADMNPILDVAKRAGIAVLEDCAEAPGASYFGKQVGSMGQIGIFSFQHQKCMTSGEGGLVVTSDDSLYERAVRMHDLGNYRPFHTNRKAAAGSPFCGGQYRMSELTGAVALAQFRKIPFLREHCRSLAMPLREAISEFPALRPRRIPDPGGDLGYETYFFAKSEAQRDEFVKRLDDLNVRCVRMTGTYGHYARPYCQNAAAHTPSASPFLGFETWPAPGYRPEDFPVTESLANTMVAVPVGVLHAIEDAQYMADAIKHVAKALGLKS